ncbi:hypothetical protein KC19_1G069000 [Ceratodon purpureus]|uniref:Uncharacterized protein n=1 Tax=Ceratodon purpureus TaxID=3225 RepID=A0A8T0J2D7_CERPU|nr:hypothetical protein KC19_1G069000 [Ceratodon purpureus]
MQTWFRKSMLKRRSALTLLILDMDRAWNSRQFLESWEFSDIIPRRSSFIYDVLLGIHS